MEGWRGGAVVRRDRAGLLWMNLLWLLLACLPSLPVTARLLRGQDSPGRQRAGAVICGRMDIRAV